MKNLFFLFVLFFTVITYQSNATNEYFKVIGSTPCSNELEIESSSNLEIGDKIVLIQMNGAIIDRSNTEKYGDIIDFNGAGQFEFNEVLLKNGNKITFKYKIKDGYDFTAAIQLIKVENVKDLVVNSNPDVKSWDVSTGGVLVLYAEESITLNSDIDVSGKGFRGGTFYNSNNHSAQLEGRFFLTANNDFGGNKGEGIGKNDYNYGAGKGKNANGGGGGNACNAGGAGGGNLSYGGKGGNSYDGYPTNHKENGIGGGIYDINSIPLVLGGGGGTGHSNNNFGTTGANGGGIVLVITKSLISNNHTIASNGENVNTISGIDGAGGGGGAGSVILLVADVKDELNIELIGGQGGNLNNRGGNNTLLDACHGPGGGGSGGTLYLQKENMNVIGNLSGGKAGKTLEGRSSCTGTSYGAQDGEIGKRLIYPLPIQNEEYVENTNFYFKFETAGNCEAITNILSLEPISEIVSFKWYDNNNQNPRKILNEGQYKAEITAKNGCIYEIDTTILSLPKNSNGIFETNFSIDNYNKIGNFKNQNNGIILTENKSNHTSSIWQTPKINLTKDFKTSFGFRVYKGFNNFMFEQSYAGADGFALIFHGNYVNQIGQTGGGIGYAGIPNSLAIELDLFGNYLKLDEINDPNGNHLAVFSNKDKENISNHQSDALIAEKLDIIEVIGDSTIYYFNVEYKFLEQQLTVSISKDSLVFSNSLTLDNFNFTNYLNLINGEFGSVGISAATGTAVQVHEVLDWMLCAETTIINSVETELKNDIIYPNPTTDYIQINKLNANELKIIKIYDNLGNLQIELNSNQIKENIDVDILPIGIYFIELINNNNTTIFSKFNKIR